MTAPTALQGNLDPLRVVAGGKALDEGVDAILSAMRGRAHIFNLGHGITPDTPIAHVERLVERVRESARMMLWVKAFHIISVIAWMAAQLYLPRLLVYHAEAPVGSDKSETFKVMERRLLRGIANPAMIATFVFGIWLATLMGVWSDGWLHAKLAFRARALRLPRAGGALGSGVRRGPEPAFGPLLPDGERDPRRLHGRDRDPGGRETLLTQMGLCRDGAARLFSGLRCVKMRARSASVRRKGGESKAWPRLILPFLPPLFPFGTLNSCQK